MVQKRKKSKSKGVIKERKEKVLSAMRDLGGQVYTQLNKKEFPRPTGKRQSHYRPRNRDRLFTRRLQRIPRREKRDIRRPDDRVYSSWIRGTSAKPRFPP